jgi:glycosyltransferase involved in cell wall biosynthesis
MGSAPLSVLLVLDSMSAGGTETHVLSLMKGLRDKGVQVCLASADGGLRAAFAATGCAVYKLEAQDSSMRMSERRVAGLQQLMLERQVDCVHAHQIPSGLMALAAAEGLGIPFVFTVHGTYYPAGSLRAMLARASQVISVSAPVQEYVRKLGFVSRLVPNGIDVTEFYAGSNDALRERLGLPEDAMLLVYASRLAWGKASACETLLRAMKDLRRYGWDKLHLAVVGEGPRLADIRRLADFIAQESGSVFIHVLGMQTDMSGCYRAADIVIGTGRVALEALACGKPVLAIGNHGFFGWVEPERYEEAWAQHFGDHGSSAAYSRYLFAAQIADGCRKPAWLKQLGSAGRSWVTARFQMEDAVDQVLDAYAAAASNKP